MHHTSQNKTELSAQPIKSTLTREAVKYTRDEIRFRAYQIYVSRNRQPGHELDDWLQAERELLSRN